MAVRALLIGGFQPGSDGGIISTGPSRGPRALCRFSVGCRARIHEGLGPFLPEGEQMRCGWNK